MGCVWMVFGIVEFIFDAPVHWVKSGYLIISIIYFILFYSYSKRGYLQINNGELKSPLSFGKKIELAKVKTIRKFAGDYILKTDDKEFGINTDLLREDSLKQLQEELKSLPVEWT